MSRTMTDCERNERKPRRTKTNTLESPLTAWEEAAEEVVAAVVEEAAAAAAAAEA